MAFGLQPGEVLAQRTSEPGKRGDRALHVVVVGDQERAHRDRREVLGQQVRIAARAHGGGRVGRERQLARGMIGIELQQLDELLRLRPHVGDQRRRLPGGHDDHVHRLVADQLDQRLLHREVARVRLGNRAAEHHAIERVRDERRAAPEQPAVDLRVPDVVEVVELGVGSDDVVDLGVVEREDDPQGADDRPRLGVPGARSIDEGLIDVRLDDRELHARLVAKQADVRRRARRRQHLQLDVRGRCHELREIRSDREIGAPLRGGHDLVLRRGRRGRHAVKTERCGEQRSGEFLRRHPIPSVESFPVRTARAPRPAPCTALREAGAR